MSRVVEVLRKSVRDEAGRRTSPILLVECGRCGRVYQTAQPVVQVARLRGCAGCRHAAERKRGGSE